LVSTTQSVFFYTGALVLFSSEDDKQTDVSSKKAKRAENVAKMLEQLGNVRRLVASILFLNDTEVGIGAKRVL